jgi:hypothetical protein
MHNFYFFDKNINGDYMKENEKCCECESCDCKSEEECKKECHCEHCCGKDKRKKGKN